MPITHVRGEFFDPEHHAMHEGFGFKGSTGLKAPDTKGGRGHKAEPKEKSGDYATGGVVEPNTKGGRGDRAEPKEDGGGDYATGGVVIAVVHPHGHSPVREDQETDGRRVMYHAHGGHTVVHPDGRVTHHLHDGAPVNMATGIESMHDESEYAHGGMISAAEDAKRDKTMISKMIGEDDRRKGLAMGGHARLPRSFKAAELRPHSPINTPPRKPQVSRTPTDSMPGGVMPYGVQPSDESGYAPSDATGATSGMGAMSGMRKGGRAGK